MGAYILRRLLLVIPTLLGIMIINFALTQFVPGGPIEQIIAELEGEGDVFSGISGGGSEVLESGGDDEYAGARGLSDDFIADLERQFGFDKPPLERFLTMMWNYIRFDFGESYFRSISVVDLILEKMPVSITLGLWSTLIAYAISIPLGIKKAVTDGSRFDWHITLPVLASTISAFATLTLLTKNSFLDEIKKQYVITAKAKGLSEKKVLYGHVFRNAMLIIISGFPALFIGVFFGGSLIIETLFSLDGLGRLGFEAAVARDYPVVFGTLFAFSLMGLVVAIITDITYVFIDPRIDFEARG